MLTSKPQMCLLGEVDVCVDIALKYSKCMYSLELLCGTSMHFTFVPPGKQQGKLHYVRSNLPCCLPAKTNIPCMELQRKSSNEYVP